MFDEVDFPLNLSYRSTLGIAHSTSIVELVSGAESRNANWERGRREYSVRLSTRSRDDVRSVIEFAQARQGSARGFRFKDPLDHTSASNGRDAPAENDQTIATADGTQDAFQLVKTYDDGIVSRVRNITKVVAGSVVIEVNGSKQTTGWSVNENTGIVTFLSPPTNGHVIKAGYEFRVPVRFGEDADTLLAATLVDFDVAEIPTISLVELIDEVMIRDPYPAGGAKEIAISADYTLDFTSGRVISIEPSVGATVVTLPDPTNIPTGGPLLVIFNASTTNNFTLNDHNATSLGTIAAGACREVYLSVDGLGDKVYLVC